MRSACVKRGGAQAPLDPVALDGVADPLRDREAEAQSGRISLPQSALNRHPLGMETAARGRRDEFCSFRQAPDVFGAWAAHRRTQFRRTGACDRGPGARRSRGDRPWWPCGRESRDGACERACWADRSSSRPRLHRAGGAARVCARHSLICKGAEKRTAPQGAVICRGLWRMPGRKSTRAGRTASIVPSGEGELLRWDVKFNRLSAAVRAVAPPAERAAVPRVGRQAGWRLRTSGRALQGP